ncbi:MAG: hypothetical protein AAGU04_03430 [Anaerolineaceae bacterium]
MKKWWLFLPLFVLVITIILIIRYRDLVEKTKRIVITTGSSVQISPDGEKKIEAQQNVYKVTKWNPETGQLRVQKTNVEEDAIDVDPATMKVLIPFKERDKMGAMMVLSETDGIAWKTAFCTGDKVNIITDDTGRIVSVMNIGQRICGAI